MDIDEKLIDHLEHLACLSCSSSEKHRISGDLGKIIGYMNRLGELDAGSNMPVYGGRSESASAFRDDIGRASLDRELVLRNAPKKEGGMFAAPEVL